MTNQLTTTTSTPEHDVARLRTRVANLYASIVRENGVDRMPALIDSVQRKELDERRRNLYVQLRSISLTRAEQDRARAAIALFLSGYLNANTNDVEGTSRAYLLHMIDQPLFAIVAAIDDFRHRRVFDIDRDGNRIPFTIDYAPTAYRLLDQVKKRAADVQEEHHRIVRLLAVRKTIDDPAISDAERARVAEHMRKLADGLAMKSAEIREEDVRKSKAEASAARDRAARIIQDAKRRNSELEAVSQEQSVG